MIKGLLLFLLAVLFFIFVAAGVVVSFLYRRFHGFFKMFRDRQDSGFGSEAFSSGSRNKKENSRTTVGDAGETVIDTRDPRKAKRKIIPSDEGEYVDFTEKQ